MPKVEVVQTEAAVTAVVRAKTDFADLATTIGRCLDKVYAALPDLEVKPWGHNIVLYFDQQMTIEVGVQVARAFEDSGEVVCSTLPSCKAVRTVHTGPYFEMRRAYERIEAWAKATGRRTVSPSWEVYGDWNDDPTKLETTIYFRLSPE